MNHGDRVTIACKPNSDHHHPEIREKRAAMNGKTGEVVTIATLSGDVLVEADGVRSWFWASELTPAPSVEADLRATIAGLRDELANEKAAHAECERLLSEERSVRAVAVRARIEAERREDEARETIDLVVRGIPEEYRGYSRPHLCIAAMLGEFDGERRAHDKTKRLLVAAVELGRAATDVVGAWGFAYGCPEHRFWALAPQLKTLPEEGWPANVTLAVGPLRTQAEADEAIPALLAVQAARHEAVFAPTEAIWLHEGIESWCEKCDWATGEGDNAIEGHLCPACGEEDSQEVPRQLHAVRVRGGVPEHIASLREQCEAAGVEFIEESA